MLPYPQIDPVAIAVGPLKVHWYGLMYVVGIAYAWISGRKRASDTGSLTSEQVDDIIFYAAIGLIIGGRTGYTLFYALPDFLSDPAMIFRVWEGGMAFHGGLLGGILALWIWGRRNGVKLFTITDFLAPMVPIGLLAGRIGNFINGELWGRPASVPWAMVFPSAGPEPRHPSQIYEALLEGVALFLILKWFESRPRPSFASSAVFLLTYGLFRFFAEFFRTPDAQLGFLAWDWLTMGQVLSFPMILAGGAALIWSYTRNK